MPRRNPAARQSLFVHARTLRFEPPSLVLRAAEAARLRSQQRATKKSKNRWCDDSKHSVNITGVDRMPLRETCRSAYAQFLLRATSRFAWIAWLSLGLAAPVRADIFRWDNRQLIPGTEGVTPGPGVQLDHRRLSFADLSYANLNLQDANFSYSDLSSARLSYQEYDDDGNLIDYGPNLAGANFENANLSDASLRYSYLAGARMAGSTIVGAHFGSTTGSGSGWTKEQLYSTASYQEKNLQRVWFDLNDLTGWDFREQDLTGAIFWQATLTDTNFSGAWLAGVALNWATDHGFTKEQLYSTASYETKNLQGISFVANALAGWNLSGQDLTNSDFRDANVSGLNLRGAKVAGVTFGGATSLGFTAQQLYLTASYREQHLEGIDLGSSNLSNWDFSGQDLTQASFRSANLSNTKFDGATVAGVNFEFANLKKEQLYSTSSYQSGQLQGIRLGSIDLNNSDLRQCDLSHAFLNLANLFAANLEGANLEGASFVGATLAAVNLKDAHVAGANFSNTTAKGFFKDYLYSTASYQSQDLRGIGLAGNSLYGWDFSGQNLTNAVLGASTLTNANFTGADMRGVTRQAPPNEVVTFTNTIRPSGVIQGLALAGGQLLRVRDYDGAPERGVPPFGINVAQSMTMSQDGTLQFVFEADDWNSTLSFTRGISVSLGGTLELLFAPDVDPASQAGRTFDLFNWTGVNPIGQFQISSPYQWDLTKLYTTGDVTLRMPGDTNGDGQVDLADLNNVHANFGGAGQGDTNADGIVNLDDLNAVRNNFGAGGGGANPVPEPPSLALLAAGAAGLAALRRKRAKHEMS